MKINGKEEKDILSGDTKGKIMIDSNVSAVTHAAESSLIIGKNVSVKAVRNAI